MWAWEWFTFSGEFTMAGNGEVGRNVVAVTESFPKDKHMPRTDGWTDWTKYIIYSAIGWMSAQNTHMAHGHRVLRTKRKTLCTQNGSTVF